MEHIDLDTDAVLNLAKYLKVGGILVISTSFYKKYIEYPDANRIIVTDRPEGSHTDSRVYTQDIFLIRIIHPLEKMGMIRVGRTEFRNVNIKDPSELSVRGLYTFGISILRKPLEPIVEEVEEVQNCPFCKDSATRKIHNSNFSICESCGIRININTNKEKMIEDVKKQMLSTCFDNPPGKRRLADARISQFGVLDKFIDKPGKVFDVGAAAGFFMKVAMEKGWEAIGNELSLAAIAWAKQHYDIDIIYGIFEDIEIPAESFDLVVMWNTLEHTFDPLGTILKAKEILKPGGFLFIAVPNKTTLEDLNKYYEPEHTFEFTAECLDAHLKKLGFTKLFEKKYFATNGIPSLIFLHKKDA